MEIITWQKVILLIVFITPTTAQAQSWSKSITDDQRKQRLNQIKPSDEELMKSKMKSENVNQIGQQDDLDNLIRKKKCLKKRRDF